MMTQLKTLEDLEPVSVTGGEVVIKMSDLVRKKDLRAEAINWIKELRISVATDTNYKIIPYDLDAKENVSGAFHYEIFESQWTYKPEEVINFIKHFFGITDEELK